MSQSSELSTAGSLFCCEDAAEVVSSVADTSISDHPSSSSSLPPYSPPSDETIVGGLIDVETHHMPDPDYPQRCHGRFIDVTARQHSINWILKVHKHYEFRPVTAFLSVNYLDRFLSCSSLPRPTGWPFQLLSVACLSLAAKMEEPHVPHLLDLQLFEPRFVFEPKTIQRMELWVMTSLKWRLRSVTPFDYLHYFISKLPSSSTPEPESELDLINRVFSDASHLILSTTHVVEFLSYAPSTIAAAAVLCSAGQRHDIHHQSPPCFHDRVNKEMVRSCHQLMMEYVVDTCPGTLHKGRRAKAAPLSSPIGVLDAATYRSCDTRSENLGSSSQAEEPSRKRLRSSAVDV